MILSETWPQIVEYKLAIVKYESLVDLTMRSDYLRCNPIFHDHPRFDFVIADLPHRGRIFAQLVSLIVCQVGAVDYHLALVQPLEKKSRPATRCVDQMLSIHRWTIRQRNRCEVIPLDSIVRGAVLVKDPRYSSDYFVIDALDDDMYLRIKLL